MLAEAEMIHNSLSQQSRILKNPQRKEQQFPGRQHKGRVILRLRAQIAIGWLKKGEGKEGYRGLRARVGNLNRGEPGFFCQEFEESNNRVKKSSKKRRREEGASDPFDPSRKKRGGVFLKKKRKGAS